MSLIQGENISQNVCHKFQIFFDKKNYNNFTCCMKDVPQISKLQINSVESLKFKSNGCFTVYDLVFQSF